MQVKQERKSSLGGLAWAAVGTGTSILMSWLFPRFIKPWTFDDLQMVQSLLPLITALSLVAGSCIIFVGITYFRTRTMFFTIAATIFFAVPPVLMMKMNADSATRMTFTTTAERFEPLIANIGKPSSGTSTDEARNALREIVRTIFPPNMYSGPDGETK